jgi:hypothetical protein
MMERLRRISRLLDQLTQRVGEKMLDFLASRAVIPNRPLVDLVNNWRVAPECDDGIIRHYLFLFVIIRIDTVYTGL